MQAASSGGPNRRAKGWVRNDIKPAVPIGPQGRVETMNMGKYKLKYIFTLYLSISWCPQALADTLLLLKLNVIS